MGLFSKKTFLAAGRSKRHDQAKLRGDKARAAINADEDLNDTAYGDIKTSTRTRPRPTMAIYFDKSNGWRWRLTAANGKIVADSGEAYTQRYDARKAALKLAQTADMAKLQVGEK